MLLEIPHVLPAAEVGQLRKALDEAQWVDGRAAGVPQSMRTADNVQLPEDSPVAAELGGRILRALPHHPSAVQLSGVYHNLLRRWAEV